MKPGGDPLPSLGPRELETLQTLCEALVPAGVGPGDAPQLTSAGAHSRGVDGEIARIWREWMTPDQRREFSRFLRVVDSPWWDLLLSGRIRSFRGLTPEGRERFLRDWASSRLSPKRRGFQVVKRLTTFLFYATELGGSAPAFWPEIGYPASSLPREAPRGMERPAEPDRLTFDSDTDLTADVCVVGSGAGGSAIADSLAESGAQVVILEAGPYRDRTTFRGSEGEAMSTMFERHGLLSTRDLSIQVLAGATAGGSTTVNWMTCLRPSSFVREEWSRAGFAPAGTSGFDQEIQAVEARLSVGRAESQVNPSNEALRRGAERLGFVAGRDFDVIDRNAKGCENRCDFCAFGCIYDAKRSALVTYLADARQKGARLACDTWVERVVLEAGRVRAVEAVHRNRGRTLRVRVHAPQVVLSAGAIQTPAILRRSGLTSSGIGQGLRLHPTTALLAEYPHPVEPWKGPMQTVVVRKFVRSDTGEHGPWLEAAPAHPGLAALAVPWTGGAEHKRAMQRLPRTAATIVLVRDLAEGRVTVDSAGESVLDYLLTRRDRTNLLRGIAEAARIHAAAGAVRLETLHAKPVVAGDGTTALRPAETEGFVEEVARAGIVENAVQLFSAHPTGSARFGRDPSTSAVDPRGQVHGVEGLWVGDGSLFPTAPGVNPMIAILAVARQVAGSIRAARAAGNR